MKNSKETTKNKKSQNSLTPWQEKNINMASNNNYALKLAMGINNLELVNMLLNNDNVIKEINKKWIDDNIKLKDKRVFVDLVKKKIKKNILRKYKKNKLK